MPFTNNQILIDSLPEMDKVNYFPLHKNHLIATSVGLSLFFLVLLLIGVVTFLFWDDLREISLWVFIMWIVTLLLSMVYNYYHYKNKGYALREHDIIYKEGVIIQSVMAVPFNRVQHSEVTQGPIDRYLNLSSLHIFTAGGSSSDLIIPGIKPDEANRLRDFIVSKTKGLDEEE